MPKQCIWYNETSGVKRAYDAGLIDYHWIDDYCMNAGRKCVRKQRWEGRGYISPDWVMPDGSEDAKVKEWIQNGRK